MIKPRGIKNVDMKNSSITFNCDDYDENLDELKKYIHVSPFSFKIYKRHIKQKDIHGKEVEVALYTGDSYAIIYGKLIDIIKNRTNNIQLTTLSVLFEICEHVPYGCNYCEVTLKEMSNNLCLDIATINRAVQTLIDITLIARKNRSGYIINHNYLLNGSINVFCSRYKKLYPQEFMNATE